ncbi:MAG TPA: Rrf2 family transcriptional regulator [Chthonomonadaceae bacterium]|nr:Rrf2 family transcriptional regulator [Chthonomonadaceae bacterium]
MLSQTAEYALRAVVFLAEQGNKPHTIQQIAAATQVPAGYLAKVMQALARHELVLSQRGLGGGFTLAIPAEKLTIYEVIQAVDPIRRITKCPLNNPAHERQLCALHRRLDEAMEAVEQSFRASTVAEMASALIFSTGTNSQAPCAQEPGLATER